MAVSKSCAVSPVSALRITAGTRLRPIPVSLRPRNTLALLQIRSGFVSQLGSSSRTEAYYCAHKTGWPACVEKAPPEQGRLRSVRRFIAPGPGPLQLLNRLPDPQSHTASPSISPAARHSSALMAASMSATWPSGRCRGRRSLSSTARFLVPDPDTPFASVRQWPSRGDPVGGGAVTA